MQLAALGLRPKNARLKLSVRLGELNHQKRLRLIKSAVLQSGHFLIVLSPLSISSSEINFDLNELSVIK